MLSISITELLPLKDSTHRLLGLDVGDRTIGLALSDPLWTIASPLEVIRRKQIDKDLQYLQSVTQKHQIAALVVGLPINMNGSEGPQAEKVRTLVKKIDNYLETMPIALWDERLSTMAITRTLLEADVSRSRRKEVVDKMAASYILQGALDALRIQT